MCGIVGLALNRQVAMTKTETRTLIERLLLLSESRGSESAGCHFYLPDAAKAWTVKGAMSASKFISSMEFTQTLATVLDLAYSDSDSTLRQPLVMLGHSRLVTNGQAELLQNNQPVRSTEVTLIHNGIIVNVDELWRVRTDLKRFAEVDTEILCAMIASAMASRHEPIHATQIAYSAIEGAASIAWVHSRGDNLVLATNTGDLYHAGMTSGGGLFFASERYILRSALHGIDRATHTKHLHAGTGLNFDLRNFPMQNMFSLKITTVTTPPISQRRDTSTSQTDVVMRQLPVLTRRITQTVNESLLRYNEQTVRELKRCKFCVLPETFPYLKFDDQGICNYCRAYKPKYQQLDLEAAKRVFVNSLERYRNSNGCPDVLVPFSGGRDSCYGLHLIKQELGLNPITFTYDWGMITDLARRNISRLCGQLGVQNLLVSANIEKKRRNIRKNVSAWLNRPNLGVVPLFMAGDKHFFKILNEVKMQTGIHLNIWSANPLENTDFKVGFCGIKPKFEKRRIDYLPLLDGFKLLGHYGTSFLMNPRLLNSSLMDTASAFHSYYLQPRRDFVSLFHHLVWDETVVNDVIVNQYGFESATDSPSTWRIGDGSAPFYNYIYTTANGFSEFDAIRSNQIREGQITRAVALNCIVEENRPRVDGLRWYFDTIQLNFNEVVPIVNKLDTRGLHL